MASVMASNVPNGLLKHITMPNWSTIYTVVLWACGMLL